MKKRFTYIIVAMLLFVGMSGVAQNTIELSSNGGQNGEGHWISTFV